jgi:hypothetical protein
MVQQSNTESRGTEKIQGRKTREQQKAIIEKREPSNGTDVDPHRSDEQDASGARASQFDNSSGDRAIQHGANQESEHRKRRSH